MVSPPGHGVTSKARHPDQNCNQITKRNQPGVFQKVIVLQDDLTNHQRNHETKGKRDSQRNPRPEGSATRHCRQQCPHESKCENQTQVATGTSVADSSCPAQLMGKKIPQSIRREKRLDHNLRQLHAQSQCGDALSQFVVVRKTVRECNEATDLFQLGATKSQGGTQPETNAALNLPCGQHTRAKICADS